MSIKLLIADDEDMIRYGIEKYIKLHTDRFDKIYVAEDGAMAIELIFKYKPDIMLLDVQMPLKSGIEVMQEASRANILPATIILSGYDEFKYAQQAIRYGARDYMLKPSRSSDILEKLQRLADELFGCPKSKKHGIAGENHPVIEIAVEYIKDHYYENLTQDRKSVV